MQLIVVGFHRSGTSLLTQLLHEAGLFVGDDLLGARPSNPYGHYEDREVLELHRAILRDNATGWQVDEAEAFHIGARRWDQMLDIVQRRESAHASWGFKDPRVCLFLGAWKHVMPDARFVIVYRDPGECVRSMETRQATDLLTESGPVDEHRRFFTEPDHGLRTWLAHNDAAIAFARAHLRDCLVLPFTDLAAGYPVIDALNRRFGARLRALPTEAVFDAGATSRRDSPQWVHDHALATRIESTWRQLENLATLTEVAL